MAARALPQGVTHRDRAAVLLRERGKGLLREFVEVARGGPRERVGRGPGRIAYLAAFAGHQRRQRSWRSPCPAIATKSGVAAPMLRPYFAAMILLPDVQMNSIYNDRSRAAFQAVPAAFADAVKISAAAETSERRLVRGVATTSSP